MARATEILFVDPAVDDVETILCGLRPGVEAIVLDPTTPAVRQIAAALDGLRDLEGVHVIAHGAPGRVSFSAGEWSLATIRSETELLNTIGRALNADGQLLLWSCATGKGDAGEEFVCGLAEAAGAEVAAATGLIGCTEKGGEWNLSARSEKSARVPLTKSAASKYAGVLATRTWIGGGNTTVPTSGTWDSSNTSNWSGGIIPVAGDTVVLGGNGSNPSYTVTLGIDTPSLATVTISDPNAILQVNNGATGHTLSATTLSLTGKLIGFGTVTANISGTGTITANTSGQVLNLSGTIASSGPTVQIGAGAILELQQQRHRRVGRHVHPKLCCRHDARDRRLHRHQQPAQRLRWHRGRS